MTCLQILQIARKEIWDTTVAERGAIFRHIMTCNDCREYMHKIEPAYDAEEDARLDALIANDMKDPEF